MANAMDYILVDSKTKQRVAVGDTRKDFRGEEVIVSGFSAPRHEGSTGRVDLRDKNNNYLGQFFPSVVGLSIEKR
jgi:hypothetical protein